MKENEATKKLIKILLWFCAIGLYIPFHLWYPGRDGYATISEIKIIIERLCGQPATKEG